MSYASLLKNIPDILSQPAGIAAIASVGIHGAIAFILPLMPVDSSKSTKQVSSTKPIGLVELSQADQNRLPQIPPTTPQVGIGAQLPLQPQVPLPNFANQPKLTPLPPALSSQVILPPIPKTPTTNYPVASLPKGQYERTIPQNRANFQIDTSGFNANTKSAQSFPRFDNRDLKIARSSQPLTVDGLPKLRADNRIPQGIPNTVASENPSDSLPSTPIETGNNTPLANVPLGDDVSRVTPNPDLIASVGETPKVGENLSLAGQSLPQWQQGSSAQIPELPLGSDKPDILGKRPLPLGFNQLDTPLTPNQGLMAKTTTLAEQFVKIKQQYPNIETKQPIALAIDKVRLDKRVEVGLVVKPDGKEVESVEFLDKSVSSENQIAIRKYLLEYLQKNPAQANGKPKYYTFSLSPSLSPKSGGVNNSEATRSVLPTLPTNQTSLAPTPQATGTLSGLRIIDRQRLPIVPANETPLLEVPVGGKQPLLVPQINKPQSPQARVGKNPTLPVLQANQQQLSDFKPESPQVGVRKNQTMPVLQANQQLSDIRVDNNQPTPTAQVNKQQLLGARIRNSQPLGIPQASPKPSPAPEIASNQPSFSVKSSEELIQKLRDLRKQRETSNQ